MSIYTDNGYSSREEYLDALREDYGVHLVNRLLPRFKPSQDFDDLVIALEDSHYNTEEEEPEEEEEEEYYIADE